MTNTLVDGTEEIRRARRAPKRREATCIFLFFSTSHARRGLLGLFVVLLPSGGTCAVWCVKLTSVKSHFVVTPHRVTAQTPTHSNALALVPGLCLCSSGKCSKNLVIFPYATAGSTHNRYQERPPAQQRNEVLRAPNVCPCLVTTIVKGLSRGIVERSIIDL